MDRGQNRVITWLITIYRTLQGKLYKIKDYEYLERVYFYKKELKLSNNHKNMVNLVNNIMEI